MTLYLDDRKTELDLGPQTTMGELIDVVKRRVADDGAMLVRIECDGLDVTGANFGDTLDQPIAAYRRIDMQSADPKVVVSDALQHALEILESSRGDAEAAAEMLVQGNAQQAMPRLGQCCKMWLEVHQGICNAAGLLEMDIENLAVEGRPLVELLGAPIEQLRELKQAIEAQDFVLVADLLRYELPGAIDTWKQVIDAVRGGMPQSS